MSLTASLPASTPVARHAVGESSTRAVPADASSGGANSTLASIATATGDSVSATVSFSGKALRALEALGTGAVDAVEHAAVAVERVVEAGWSDVESGLSRAEQFGESVVNSIENGLSDVVSATKSAASEVSSLAGSAVDSVSSGASDLTSTVVFATAAGEKTLRALL